MKLAEALIKQKKLKNQIDETLFKIEKIDTVSLLEISEKQKGEERVKSGQLLESYRTQMVELIAIKRRIQSAGFEHGIKDQLVEFEELKSYLSILKGLSSKGPMGKEEWDSMNTSSNWESEDKITVQNFWPVDQVLLESEKQKAIERIERIDVAIQKKNWEVEV